MFVHRTSPWPRRSEPLGEPSRAPRWGRGLDDERLGEDAEVLTRLLGSGRFLAIQTFVVAWWIGLNLAAWRFRWDPYPFYGLNLAFSVQAAYAAPLILLAQRRQDSRDRAQAERDRLVGARTQAQADFVAREIASLRVELADAACRADLERGLLAVSQRIAEVRHFRVSDDTRDATLTPSQV